LLDDMLFQSKSFFSENNWANTHAILKEINNSFNNILA
jgi:hypothetical protein